MGRRGWSDRRAAMSSAAFTRKPPSPPSTVSHVIRRDALERGRGSVSHVGTNRPLAPPHHEPRGRRRRMGGCRCRTRVTASPRAATVVDRLVPVARGAVGPASPCRPCRARAAARGSRVGLRADGGCASSSPAQKAPAQSSRLKVQSTIAARDRSLSRREWCNRSPRGPGCPWRDRP